MTARPTEKQLFRSRDDAFVGGVCAGIADYFNLDSIVVRILAILLTGLTFGAAGITYLVLWASLPFGPEASAPYDITPESAESNAYGCIDHLQAIGAQADDDPINRLPLVARLAVAAGLMLVFLMVAINVAPLVPGTRWWQFWPLIPLMAGLCLIIIPIRTRFEATWHAAGIVLTSLAASLLPMTLGMMSWGTVGCALQQFWPALALGLALSIVGMRREINVLVLSGAFCFVAFCLMGLTFCALPGEIDAFLLQMPSGRSFHITFTR